LVFYFRNREAKSEPEGYKITLGAFLFDTRKQILSHQNTDTELTSKESELLHLLYKHLNETVERDYLLQQVWGGSGDYIGRTPDVYISKLRKKLEADPRLQIINVRGVGYKLVVND
jgi:DNA-binding response OmpR family regulator